MPDNTQPDTSDDIGAGRWATPDPSNKMPQDMQKMGVIRKGAHRGSMCVT